MNYNYFIVLFDLCSPYAGVLWHGTIPAIFGKHTLHRTGKYCGIPDGWKSSDTVYFSEGIPGLSGMTEDEYAAYVDKDAVKIVVDSDKALVAKTLAAI